MAWWSVPSRAALMAMTCTGPAACSDGEHGAARPPSTPAGDAAIGAPAATTAPGDATTRPTAAGSARVEPAAADGFVTLDLSAAGDAWAGTTARTPASATLASDGSGGAIVFLGPGRPIVLSTSPAAIADHRLGATTAATVIGGATTFSTDTTQEIAYEQRGDDRDGNPLHTWGFATTVTLGRARVTCSYATARDAPELAAARAVCASLARR